MKTGNSKRPAPTPVLSPLTLGEIRDKVNELIAKRSEHAPTGIMSLELDWGFMGCTVETEDGEKAIQAAQKTMDTARDLDRQLETTMTKQADDIRASVDKLRESLDGLGKWATEKLGRDFDFMEEFHDVFDVLKDLEETGSTLRGVPEDLAISTTIERDLGEITE